MIDNQELYEINFDLPYEKHEDKTINEMRELRTQAIDNISLSEVCYFGQTSKKYN